ncbi:hypothetical protein D3C87_1728010 [compost metagenome]
MPIFGPQAQHFFQRQHHHRAGHTAPAQADAAHQHHDQQVGRLGPLHQVGRDEQVVVGQQRARQARRRAAKREGHELDAVDRITHGFHARFVFADALQGGAETRGHHAAEHPHQHREQRQHQVIEADIVGQVDARQRGIAGQVQPVFPAVLA